MTFPTVRSGQPSVETGNTTTHSVLLPTPIESGDLLLVFMSFDGAPTVTWDNSTAGTWTQQWDTANGSDCKGVCYAKVADGTEDGKTLSISTGAASEQSVTRAVAYQDWEGTLTNGLAVGTPATGTSDSPNPPSVNPSWGSASDRAFIAVAHNDFSRTVTAYPTNYTINQFNDVSGGGAGCGLGTAKRELNTGSAEDPGVFTISNSDQWVAGTIAIRPTDNQTVSPGALALTLVAVAPTRIDQQATPGAAGLALVPVAPSVTQEVTPAALAVTLALPAPEVQQDAGGGPQNVEPAAFTLTLTPVAPAVTQQVEPASLGLSLSPQSPAVAQEVTPAPLGLTFGFPAPSVAQEVMPTALPLTLAPVAPSVEQAVNPAAIALGLTAVAPADVQDGASTNISPTALALTLSLVSPVVQFGGVAPVPHVTGRWAPVIETDARHDPTIDLVGSVKMGQQS